MGSDLVQASDTGFAPRLLGRSGQAVSAIGAGCWTIGGPWTRAGRTFGWGSVDDDASVVALRTAVDSGITLFDTADVYGCGHSERVVGRALADVRDEVVIATKFGRVFDEERREVVGARADSDYVRAACRASLRRLGTDRIDLFQLHLARLPVEYVDDLVAVLEELVHAGDIRWYGWSTDDPIRARMMARGAHCTAIQHERNLLCDAAQMRKVCARTDLAPIGRSPLAMGLLTGCFTGTRPAHDDVRSHEWDWDSPGLNGSLEAIRHVIDILGAGSRTSAQSSLAWLLSTDPAIVPVVGFRSADQVRDNAAVLRQPPIASELLDEARAILAATQPVLPRR